LLEPSSLYLSLIVPAYNEERRLSAMLTPAVHYLQRRSQQDPRFSWEVIVGEMDGMDGMDGWRRLMRGWGGSG